MRTTLVVVVLIVVVIIGIIGYAVTGFAYATARVASTDRTLNTVISHQNTLNTTFKNIDSEFGALSGSTKFNSAQAQGVADEFVAGANKARAMVDQDDASLAAASKTLHDRRWLTVFSQGLLDKEAGRVGHARKALADARTISAGYVLDGQFLQAFLAASSDLDTLATETSNSDLSAASATVASMKKDVDKALQLSTGPGLPPDLHSLMNDFETLVADFAKLIAAAQANDDSATNAAAATIQSDADKISAYNYDKISAEISSYYQPLVADFNSEMAAATA
ncbi:MAG TPA: hypothetical protein VLU92_09355 [Candidatus Dormibacteraeota bacterium]|nr:hypothetical protein [Candidatus Dormibacteraeota bacterium]